MEDMVVGYFTVITWLWLPAARKAQMCLTCKTEPW